VLDTFHNLFQPTSLANASSQIFIAPLTPNFLLDTFPAALHTLPGGFHLVDLSFNGSSFRLFRLGFPGSSVWISRFFLV
jgi:hypothetical protein